MSAVLVSQVEQPGTSRARLDHGSELRSDEGVEPSITVSAAEPQRGLRATATLHQPVPTPSRRPPV